MMHPKIRHTLSLVILSCGMSMNNLSSECPLRPIASSIQERASQLFNFFAQSRIGSSLKKLDIDINGSPISSFRKTIALSASTFIAYFVAQASTKKEILQHLNNGTLDNDPAVLRNIVLENMIKEYEYAQRKYMDSYKKNPECLQTARLHDYVENLQTSIVTLLQSSQTTFERICAMVSSLIPAALKPQNNQTAQ